MVRLLNLLTRPQHDENASAVTLTHGDNLATVGETEESFRSSRSSEGASLHASALYSSLDEPSSSHPSQLQLPSQQQQQQPSLSDAEIALLQEENKWLRQRVLDLEGRLLRQQAVEMQQQLKQQAQDSHQHHSHLLPRTDLSALTPFSILRAHQITVGRKLGEGAFGVVYRGQWRGITCALKFLSPAMATELQNEVSIMDQIDHPNIVRLYGVIVDPDQDVPASWTRANLRPPCVLLEYMGYSYDKRHVVSTLIDFLSKTIALRNQQQHWIQVCGMLQGAARGMAYLHAHGVIHRDLKGMNLLLDSRGNLKIADLGLATLRTKQVLAAAASSSSSPVTTTASGDDGDSAEPPPPRRRPLTPSSSGELLGLTTAAGTYTHMAPEVMESGNYDSSADVFSFGIVMSEAVASQEAEAIVDETRTPAFGLDTTKLAKLYANQNKIATQLVRLAGQCCVLDPSERPHANQIVGRLQLILLEYQSSRLQKATVKESSFKAALRAAMENEASDKVFRMADKDGDGYLDFAEMNWLAKVSSGDETELSREQYESICRAANAESAQGLTAQHVLKLYRELRAGDAVEDWQILRSLQRSSSMRSI
jgi:serine/threonine protein kinase